MLFALWVIMFFVLLLSTITFLSFMEESNGWTEIRYFKWNFKAFLQSQDIIKKDKKFVECVREVYKPTKREMTLVKDKSRLIKLVCDKVFTGAANEYETIRFDFVSEFMSAQEIRKMSLEIVVDLGYPDARMLSGKYTSYTVEINLESKS